MPGRYDSPPLPPRPIRVRFPRRRWASDRGGNFDERFRAQKLRRSRMLGDTTRVAHSRTSRSPTQTSPGNSRLASTRLAGADVSGIRNRCVREMRRMMEKMRAPVNRLARVCHWNSGESNEADEVSDAKMMGRAATPRRCNSSRSTCYRFVISILIRNFHV